tara:strand:+ start:52 stop:603 length:552 start_codon:yes stop_codon:yes gene_type:complete
MTKDKRIIERFEKKEKYFNDNQLKNEIWKPLVGYEEIYKISNFGRIWSIVRRGGGGCFKKINFNKITGYYSVHLDNMDGGKKVYLHRLIALNFIPNLENKPCVDHINRNRQDNRIENLRWASYIENNLNRELKGCIYLNKRKYNNKTYIYYRAIIGKVNVGSFKSYEEAEEELNKNLKKINRL